MKAASALFLFLASAASPPETCTLQPGRVQPVYDDPFLLSPVEAGVPVAVRKDAVVAEEVQTVDILQWATADDVGVRLEGRTWRFTAGSIVTRLRTAAGTMDCFWAAALERKGPGADRGVVTCLVDENGDNWRETARLLDVAGGDRVSAVPLIGSTRLLGMEGSDRHIVARRRIRVGSVSETEAVLVLEHAAAVGERDAKFRPKANGSLRVPLKSGEVRLGGLRLRVGGSPGHWTVTPLDSRFPTWVTIGCGVEVSIGRGAV
jgi:hypothetical protein